MKCESKIEGACQSGFSLLEMVVVVLIILVVTGMAIPKLVTIVQNIRTSGDASSLNSEILMAKMRASSDYAQSRLHVNATNQTFWVEVEPSGSTSWTMEGGTQYLSRNVTFGSGALTAPPSGTQSSLAQAPACTGFSNSACITFNSRGIPVDTSNTPNGDYAIYVTDGKTVSGVTVSITGLTQIWRADDVAGATWVKH